MRFPVSNSVGILLATYNGERYVGELLESIFQQSWTNWYLFVSDDCSKDRTVKIIRDFARKDKRIKIISEGKRFGSAKKNFSFLMNYAHKKTKLDIFMFADQDDVWHENKIEITIEKLMEISDGGRFPALVHTDLIVVDENLNTICDSLWKYQRIDPSRNKLHNLLIQNVATGATTVFNRKLLDISSTVPEEAIMHDWWLALVASAFGRIDYIEEKTVLYRQHSMNDTGAVDRSWSRMIPLSFDVFLHPWNHTGIIKKLIVQAEAFLRIFRERLGPAEIKTIEKFISLPKHFRPLRPFILLRSPFNKSDPVRSAGFYYLSMFI